MIARFIPKSAQFHRCLSLISSRTHFVAPNPLIPNPNRISSPRPPQFSFFSTRGNNGGHDSTTSTTDFWKMSSETDQDFHSVFSMDPGNPREFGGGDDEGPVEDYTPWSFSGEGKEQPDDDLFGGVEADGEEIGLASLGDGVGLVVEKSEEEKHLEAEAKALADALKGSDLSFGDLILASGITDEMLDSLIALKDFEGIQGLPPLSEIEEKRYEKNTKKSGRAEIERQKQEEAAKARVRKVDEKGRSYGTGRRKCSIARVWLQPGDGNFLVNDKEFDVYFPMLDHRAALLRPFSETKTLGMWDIYCTVKGGGTTGQVGAVRLGISRALQNWEPGMRPPLKQAGFLTRDSRVVERKKPGKAKARKSFQWVKR
ncbi:30S ribosomal protein S9, mitochondrial-like [Salvia splendens]|uniref:30S ribosomal protein S9, mitochondrial-like n=1 Tax=Salvia splendens TaxID=180675 RepID=UPI00110242A5|nr:30S ribosomal protein S9, mitochondrial-like [Salvia splendens]